MSATTYPPRPRRATSTIHATHELYPEFVQAYDWFNGRLFASILPPALITLQREKSTLGFFSQHRFVRYDMQLTHEIALNPAYFASRTVHDTLSTLVHEMVHLWQCAFGTPGRRGYHNKEWAAMCEAVGLMPSHTGREGGNKVGEKMDHYIIPGGPFERAADELLARGWRISWIDRFPAEVPVGLDLPPDYRPLDVHELAEGGVETVPVAVPSSSTVSELLAEATPAIATLASAPLVRAPPPPEPLLSKVGPAIAWPSDYRAPVTRTKYRCPGCGAQVWGKADLDIRCNPCDRTFYAVHEGHPRARLGGRPGRTRNG